MKTAKQLAEWILDYPLWEQATIDLGTESEMKIVKKCREILKDNTFKLDLIYTIEFENDKDEEDLAHEYWNDIVAFKSYRGASQYLIDKGYTDIIVEKHDVGEREGSYEGHYYISLKFSKYDSFNNETVYATIKDLCFRSE